MQYNSIVTPILCTLHLLAEDVVVVESLSEPGVGHHVVVEGVEVPGVVAPAVLPQVVRVESSRHPHLAL